MDLYSCNRRSEGFSVAKLTCDSKDQIPVYWVLEGTCTCQGWARGRTCRHLEIVEAFEATGRSNQGWMYDYEERTFRLFTGVEPVAQQRAWRRRIV